MEKLRTDAGWFQVQADHVDDRCETGERLLFEIVDTDDHLRHIETLVAAAKGYTAALARIELFDRQNNSVVDFAKRDTASEEIPIRGGPAQAEASDDEGTESVAAETSIQDASPFADALADDYLNDVADPSGLLESVAAGKVPYEGLPTVHEAPEESVLEDVTAEKASLEGAAPSNPPSENASMINTAMQSEPTQNLGARTTAIHDVPASSGPSADAPMRNSSSKSVLARGVDVDNVSAPDFSHSSEPREDASLNDAATQDEPVEPIVAEESTTPKVSPPSSPSAKPSFIALPDAVSSTDASTGVVCTPQALTPASCGQSTMPQVLAPGTLAISDISAPDGATHVKADVPTVPLVFRDAKSFKTEDERVVYIRGLVKKGEYTGPDELLGEMIRSFSLSVAAKMIVARILYAAGKPDSTIKLLQLPLYEYPTDPVVRSSVQHLLAKAYFAVGNFDRAIDNCKISHATRKKTLGHYHPLFLESTELLVHLFRATRRTAEAEDLRRLHFSPAQTEFLGLIDDMELAFKTSKEAALACMTDLLATFKVDDRTPATSLLERLGDFATWEFEAVVLGFDTQLSLLTILAELGDYYKLPLLAIRGNIHLNLSSNRTRPILDTLLWKAAMANNAIRFQMLLDIGGDIEADHNCLEDWNTVGAEFNSMTPLHIAARSGHIDAVRILLKGGASKEARDSDNNTPLMLADKNRHADTVELLLEHGATID
jgi:hypothetical protein